MRVPLTARRENQSILKEINPEYSLEELMTSLVAQTVKNPPAIQETWLRSLGWEDPLEEGMATSSSLPAWRIRRTEEPGGYSPRGRKESDTTERLIL